MSSLFPPVRRLVSRLRRPAPSGVASRPRSVVSVELRRLLSWQSVAGFGMYGPPPPNTEVSARGDMGTGKFIDVYGISGLPW